jgi:hypothetical protein
MKTTLQTFEESKFYNFIYDNDSVYYASEDVKDAKEDLFIYAPNARSQDFVNLANGNKLLTLVELYDVVVNQHPDLLEAGIREVCDEYGKAYYNL